MLLSVGIHFFASLVTDVDVVAVVVVVKGSGLKYISWASGRCCCCGGGRRSSSS